MIHVRLTPDQKKAREKSVEPYEMRLRDIKRQAKAAHQALLGLSGDRLALLTERRQIQVQIDRWEYTREVNRQQAADPPELAGYKLDLQSVERRLAEVEAAYEAAQEVWQPQCALVTACEEWLDNNAARLANG